jgi:uncharacterized protein YecT (DUF1311 family)
MFMRLYLAIAFLLAATAARADDVTCDKAVTQNDLNICAEDDYKAADKALNDAWNGLDGAAKTKLRPEQRGWIAARDAKCKSVAAEAEGGSMYPLLYFGCMAERTKARTRQLRATFP